MAFFREVFMDVAALSILRFDHDRRLCRCDEFYFKLELVGFDGVSSVMENVRRCLSDLGD